MYLIKSRKIPHYLQLIKCCRQILCHVWKIKNQNNFLIVLRTVGESTYFFILCLQLQELRMIIILRKLI